MLSDTDSIITEQVACFFKLNQHMKMLLLQFMSLSWIQEVFSLIINKVAPW